FQSKDMDERSAWNARFSSGSHSSLDPDPLLITAWNDYIEPLLESSNQKRALDVAGGVGRHSLYLAERGWKTTLIDASDKGVEIARENALKRQLEIDLRNDDLRGADLGSEVYDVILVFFYLDRELFPALIRALAPGGILIYKTYTREHPRFSGGKGPTHPMHLLESNELLKAFNSLQVLFYRETVAGKGVAELVARKI
ncbi:MAG TPA: class I SAM-dependent methyltransferase, partial [Terriglobales bacterium]